MTRFDANYTSNNSETGETIYTPYTYQAVVPRPFPDNATIPLLDLQRRAEDPNDNATLDDVRTRRIYNGTFFHFLFYAQVSVATVSISIAMETIAIVSIAVESMAIVSIATAMEVYPYY